MKKIKWYLVFVVLCFFCGQGSGLAETMYVTDRLYLSLRNVPHPEQPAVALLASDTKVEVLQTEGDWAEVTLEDGRTGWVLKRFLVENLPKSLIIEELRREIENKKMILERFQEENASPKKEISDRVMVEAKVGALKKRIEALKNQIVKQDKRLEMNAKEHTLERLKELYITAVLAFFVGLAIGYLLRRSKKKRQLAF